MWKQVCGYKLDVRFRAVQVCTDVAMAVSQFCDVITEAHTSSKEIKHTDYEEMEVEDKIEKISDNRHKLNIIL